MCWFCFTYLLTHFLNAEWLYLMKILNDCNSANEFLLFVVVLTNATAALIINPIDAY